MPPFLLQLLALVDDEPAASVDCHHGLWNASTSTCDCASGWTTDWMDQDILGEGLVYCDSQASTPAPGNTTAATSKSPASIRTIWIIVIVAAATVVTALGLLCFCCCRRRRRDATKKKECERAGMERRQQQCRLEELERRRQEDEADWSREAMLRRQMWDSQMQRCLRSDPTTGEVWYDSPENFTAATTNSQFLSFPVPSGAPFAGHRKSMALTEFPAFTDPNVIVRSTSPSMRYQAAPIDLSSNLYDSDSSRAFTTAVDECIRSAYSQSPPPALSVARMVRETSPLTTPRHVKPYDRNRPY
ncbi:hypothetical protein ABB37_03754 [Leptomonas pyrrhocoris]|uniref:Uncharacterized protein n=1 Tax=Leptomonas pyrrhocoris TaxID=157538 RepID=A0A0M9G339_LEPPY|nr:hypothetical protein ABB37_03754 [Leptomonas pyrrhocoris]KPA81375.1 hypothetical protein ABB37_03754 [Leptomonas pyrrhocoris]|eukprot:XP_015659814.1 hypothetical protein ABB37_03754 [Leptomonas pyrrhocoris]